MPLHNPLWEVIEPYLVATGLWRVSDPTYGRYLLPAHPPHLEVLENPALKHTWHRIFLPPVHTFKHSRDAWDTTEITHSEEIEITKDEIARGVERGGRWVVYSVWEMEKPPAGGWEESGRGRGRDMVLLHGLSDYGLRYAPHIEHFLKAGFRVIIPDFPSYGRSTGVNSYLPSLMLLPSATHAVLTDVVQNDQKSGREQRKVFLVGASMGGWAALYYILKYPPTPSADEVADDATLADTAPPKKGRGKGYQNGERPKDEEKPRPQIAGAFVMCPALEPSAKSRPSKFVEYIARIIKYFAGPLPLAKALRGNVSDDPRVEADFYSDPLCYHGWLRVATGLSLLEGMTELAARCDEVNVPIKVIHGNHDRVVDYHGTLRLSERLPNKDKSVQIYDGYEHVMMKVGIDKADDEKRQRVLKDCRDWLLERC